MSKKFDLLDNPSAQHDPNCIYLESERRDIFYSALVKDIVQNNRTSQKYKLVFFVMICAAFIAICIVGSIVILRVSNAHDISYADMGVAITGFAGVISAIVVLPKIIAKHLFPENSETARFSFIRDNQRFDLENNNVGDDSDGPLNMNQVVSKNNGGPNPEDSE